MKKFISLILSILIITGTFSCLSFTTASAASSSQYNIIARANYLWNTVWTCQKNVSGWRYNNTFQKGTAYHLPYGQPIESGQYIGYGISVNDFLAATKNPNSIFYTSKSLYNGWYSTYYANDCSAFVSWCWDAARHTTATIPKISTYIGGANMTYIPKLQIGDALNSASAGHVVLVTGLTYRDGELATIQITEQTPPQLKRTHYTPQQLEAAYSSSYSIYRYTGWVEQAPTAGVEQPEETQPTETVPKYFPACNSSETSITAALNSIGVDSSLTYRKTIAAANGISNYSGSADQNTQMLNLLKQGLLINPKSGTSSGGGNTNTNLPEVNPPLGAFESITTGASSLTLKGWAYDPDDTVALLDIHVYIGGDSTSATAEHHILKADQLREDIGTAYTAGKYHGYSGTVNTDKTGTQDVHVYAGNVGTGHDMYLGMVSVNIPKDTTAPVITDAEISDITNNSYTVSCKVSDNSGTVTSVKFPTFLSTQTLEDAVWYEGTVENGIATAVIPVNKDGIYNTHIYAYDYKGNYSTAELSTEIISDTIAPEITNPVISHITKDGYTVSCNVTDNTAVSSVKFASFHSTKTIDDAVWYEGTIENGVATVQIPVKELGNLNGTYHTHIYAYDNSGNFSVEEVSTNVDVDINAPSITDIEVSDITLEGYTVTCNITDENKITDVKFTSYKISQTIDKSQTSECSFENGVATARIPADGNGTYLVRISAYDNYNNHSTEEILVTVDIDTTAPLISDVKITNVTNSGYTVSCNVADNKEISSVKFPSFHSSKTIDDAIWFDGTVKNGVATAVIPVEELGNLNGTYYTHIYAYDINGNYSVEEASVQVITDITGPLITDIKISNISHTSYTVSCKVSDDAGVTSVKFPSFHSSKTIDDAVWYEGKIENGIATAVISVAELGNYNGTYHTQIYAYDSYQNLSVKGISTELVTDVTAPVISNAQTSGITNNGYTVSCNVADENGISNVKFLSYHSSQNADQGVWYEGTINNTVATSTIPVAELGNLNGTYYTVIYAYDIYGNYSTQKVSAEVITDISGPEITNVKISKVSYTGYTVSCNISDDSQITSVKFPSFHSSKTIDEAIWYEGKIENGVASAVISVADLGNLSGKYNTYIYAYDCYGNCSTATISAEIITDISAPSISDIKITNVTNANYTVSCKITDDSQIESVKFPSFHSSKTLDEAIWYEGTIKNGVATVTIPVEELGNLNGTYYTHIYAYDIYGNCGVREATAQVVTDITGPEISEIKITDITNTGYTVSCKITDDSQIESVKFPSFHSSKTLDDAIWYNGKIENGVATVTIPVEELGNLSGTYYTHIYAYDIYGNCQVRETSAQIITDITGPEISEISVTNVNKESYTVSCKINDDAGISSLKFLSLHSSLTPEQGVWYEGTVENGIVTVTIPVAELGNLSGIFSTHIYAYDSYDNLSVEKVSVEINTNLADVNCDGVVDIQDVTAIQDYVADIITLEEQGLKNADVNGDGKISVRDATTIQLYLAQIIIL